MRGQGFYFKNTHDEIKHRLLHKSVYSVEESDLEEMNFGCSLDTRYRLEELNF